MATKGKEIVKAAPAVPAVPAEEQDWERKLRERAKDVRSTLASGVPRINHKNQRITIDNQQVEGNRVAIVVLGVAWVKTFYEKEFTDGSHDTPVCYAFGHQERGLAPHAAVPDKQSESCDDCQHNKFGTALKGKGKRCTDRPTLLCLLAADLEKQGDEEVTRAISRAKEYQLQVPPTSIKILSQYVNSLGEVTDHGDISEAITEVGVQGRTVGVGYELTFSFLGKVPKEAMPALVRRGETAFERIAQPFPVLGDDGNGGAAPPAAVRPVKGQVAQPKAQPQKRR